MRTAPPELLVLGGIGSVQFGAALADKLFDDAGPGGVVLLRLVLSGAILLAFARPRLRGRSRPDLGAALAFGVVLAAMNWSFYEALARLPLSVAVTIEFTGPLAVAVAGSRRALDALWVVLAAGGVVLLATRGGHHGVHAAGVALALVAAACWASYILLSKRVGRAFAQLDGLAVALGVGAVLVIPAGVVQGGDALVRPAVVAGGLGVALLSSLIPYSLELMALRTLSAYGFGLLMSLEPAMAALAGVIVLGQALTAVVALALAMVVTASVGTTLMARSGPGSVGGEPQPEA
ncbi:MAG: DMT family transporter [Jatrophihabitans sp.]|uniref:EamA family transporter n=1 Tax=Jatrophihabitans sp. TaxID=1932789 RepID=UPI0039126E04